MFECKATIEFPNEKIIFEYNFGTWYKFKEGVRLIKGEGYQYEDFINQVLEQFPLTTTRKMIVNMLPNNGFNV